MKKSNPWRWRAGGVNPLSFTHRRLFHVSSAALLLLVGDANAYAADAPRVRELRVQHVGDKTYFQVRLEEPSDLTTIQAPGWNPTRTADFARGPRLVPQDDATHAVYRRVDVPNGPQNQFAPPPPPGQAPNNPPVITLPGVQGLEFLGQVSRKGESQFLLLYAKRVEKTARGDKGAEHAKSPAPPVWAQVPLTLNFASAKEVAVPAEAKKRTPGATISPDDLEALWAVGQAQRLAILESRSPNFSFYSFAREATGRKYNVPAVWVPAGWIQPSGWDVMDRQMYETTTGAAAITESLQRQRMLSPGVHDTGQRAIDVDKLAGIDIAEHPWQKMMNGQKPALDSLARFVPNDNYYLHGRNIRKLLELGDLLDQWGTSIAHAYEMTSRDYDVRHRYETQLCIQSTALGRLLGPSIIRSMVITGNDPYLREGSDLTLLFQVPNKGLFLAGVEPFLADARKKFSGQLSETKSDYQGVAVESFVTPLREVSLHRASVDDVVIYSNSLVALHRVLDSRLTGLPVHAHGVPWRRPGRRCFPFLVRPVHSPIGRTGEQDQGKAASRGIDQPRHDHERRALHRLGDGEFTRRPYKHPQRLRPQA
jgi:hypothetical protein